MCKATILPTAVGAENEGSPLLNLTYVFNRWLKMLDSYGKLDEDSHQDDFSAIAAVIKLPEVGNDIRRAVQRCRDYALSDTCNIDDFMRSLRQALRLMCKAQENNDVLKIKKHHDDQGMTERYRPLSRRLAKEKIRKIGKEVIYTDRHSDDAKTTRLVRRIVEKRAAQAAHRIARSHKRMNVWTAELEKTLKRKRKKTRKQTTRKTMPSFERDPRRYHYSIRRAVSFNLYNTKYTEYDAELRSNGTHWKVRHIRSGQKKLEAKYSYNTYAEAAEACVRYRNSHPEDTRPISAYRCEYCGKWHIGHEWEPHDLPDPDDDIEIQDAV